MTSIDDTAQLSRVIHRILANQAVPLSQWPADWDPLMLGLQILDERVVAPCQLQPLNAGAIEAQLKEKQLLEKPLTVEMRTTIDSTNLYLAQRLQQGLPSDRHIVLCEWQFAGRGRRGRQWISPLGRSIALTAGYTFHRRLSELGGLSLVVGLAIADTLQRRGLATVALKWPNDVLVGSGKLAGVLVELFTQNDRAFAAIGIGINVRLTSADRDQVDRDLADLGDAVNPMQRTEFVSELLQSLFRFLELFDEQGFTPFIAAFDALHALRDQPGSVIQGDQIEEGVIRGVGAGGEIALETAAGLRWFHGGEVSLRLTP